MAKSCPIDCVQEMFESTVSSFEMTRGIRNILNERYNIVLDMLEMQAAYPYNESVADELERLSTPSIDINRFSISQVRR